MAKRKQDHQLKVWGQSSTEAGRNIFYKVKPNTALKVQLMTDIVAELKSLLRVRWNKDAKMNKSIL